MEHTQRSTDATDATDADRAMPDHLQLMTSGRGFVAVHVGAGLHANKNKVAYLEACKRACRAGTEMLRRNPQPSALSVVEYIVSILEDDPMTNAGLGSNLNLDGQVQCDASIMNGSTLGFGSVGAVSDFRNPIQVASKVLQESDLGPLSLGRIPPIMLVGPGVTRWVETMGFDDLKRIQPTLSRENLLALKTEHEDTTGDLDKNRSQPIDKEDGIHASIADSLITKRTLEQHIGFQRLLEKSHQMQSNVSLSQINSGNATFESGNSTVPESDSTSVLTKKRRRSISDDTASNFDRLTFTREMNSATENKDEDDILQDTVGAICVDGFGRVAAGVSSGGIALKFSGRVSEAALFGAGCWAQDASPSSEPTAPSSHGFACSMTGAGEQICKTLLARACADIFLQEDSLPVQEAAEFVLDKKFLKSPLLRSYPEKQAGFIAVRVEPPSSEDSTSGPQLSGPQPLGPLRAEFVFAHTTQTMGVAYMSTQDSKPTATLSRRAADKNKAVFSRMVRL
ncbi:taspase, threonine aspartase, 1 [Entomortierella parvispora]|uniref:Taspase, threonine aspartase, 1 n=1 Tax=Entomortierella parvispora TaxID=205924 RepID=A0A9P3M1D6_9FUNG|nr:taspase, threonine aspartase, 1 [Entomortierella parvispora]